jgi:hypothetical protein
MRRRARTIRVALMSAYVLGRRTSATTVPDEGLSLTLTATPTAGVPPQFQTKGVDGGSGAGEAEDVDGDWFKGMWLSNGDFLRYFEAAIRAPPPAKGTTVLVNAMSNNSGMRWSLDETVAALGVVAQDDSRV